MVDTLLPTDSSQEQRFPQFVAAGQISAALKACAANVTHKGQWIEEQADTLGYGHDRFRNWYYGKAAPDTLDDFNRLIAHFGTRFLTAYLVPLGMVAVKASDTDARNIAETNKFLRTLSTQLEGLARDGRDLSSHTVPHEGKAS